MDRATNWRDFIPAIIAVIFTLLSPYLFASSIRNVAPLLGFGVIFYYLRRGELGTISIWVVVFCGLLVDILQAMPIGVGISAALLLVLVAKRRDDRQEVQKFSYMMVRFMAASAMIMIWIYLLMSLAEAQFFPITAPLVQWLLMMLSYPLIFAFCHATHQQMSQPSRQFK